MQTFGCPGLPSTKVSLDVPSFSTWNKMSRNPRCLTAVCRQTPSSFTEHIQIAEVSLTWDIHAWGPSGLWMCSKFAVKVYPAQISRHQEVCVSSQESCPTLACPFLTEAAGLTALGQAVLWGGRKEVVVFFERDWCDPEEASVHGGCRFIVLPVYGLRQARFYSSWGLFAASKQLWGLHSSAARQRDTLLAEEHPVCAYFCHQVWSDSVLNSHRYSGNSTSFLKTKGPGRNVARAAPLRAWERVMADQAARAREPVTGQMENHLKNAWSPFLLFL